MKPNILFVHTVCPAQFSDLCEYLNTTETANAYYQRMLAYSDPDLSFDRPTAFGE